MGDKSVLRIKPGSKQLHSCCHSLEKDRREEAGKRTEGKTGRERQKGMIVRVV